MTICIIAEHQWRTSFRIQPKLQYLLEQVHWMKNLLKLACTKAKSDIPDKPDKSTLCIYAFVSSAFTYVHSKMENRSGKIIKETASEA